MIKANGSKLRSMVLGGAMAGMIVLPACSEPEPQVEEVEGVIDGLEVSNARMMLAPVSGNPAAIYFDVAYNGERGISISGAEVAGAGNTEVHDTMEYNFEMTMGESGPVALTSGSEKTFEPGGLHIMVFEPSEEMVAGSNADVTLKISGGKTHKFSAEIREAGDER